MLRPMKQTYLLIRQEAWDKCRGICQNISGSMPYTTWLAVAEHPGECHLPIVVWRPWTSR